MKPSDYEQVLEVLAENPKEGASLMAIARKTGKSLPELQRFIRAHRKCFVMVDATKYKLNPNPPINGNVGSVRIRLQAEDAKQRQQQVGMWIAIAVAITASFYAINNMF